MKKFLLFTLLAILMYGSTSYAQETKQSNQTLSADVALSDATLLQDGRSTTVSFTITNRTGIQTGIKYAVVLANETATKQYIVDEFVYDETLTLTENEMVKRSVVYTAPTSLNGTYTLYILSKNEAGLPFGMVRAGTLTLSEGTPGLVLDAASCYLTVQGNAESPRYSVTQQATVAPTEQLLSHCILQNTSDGPLEITPVFVTHLNSTFGPTAEAEGGDVESITIKAKERKEIVTVLSRAVLPQTYAVRLSYGQNSNAVTYQYSVAGNFGTVINAYLDKTLYQSGDVAKLNVTWKAEGTALSILTLKATIRDAMGVQCGEATQNVTVGKTPLVVLDIPIADACAEPSIALSLTDASEGILDVATFGAAGVSPEVVAPLMNSSDTEVKSVPTLWISFIGLLLALCLLVYGIYGREKGKTVSTTPLALLFAVMIFGSVGVQDAQAATFTQNSGACNVSISYDSVSQIRTGQTINVTGYTSCPGLQVDAVFLAAGYGFSVTANAFGGFSGSFSAPPEDDVIQYVSGDTTPDPFGLGNPMYPVDYIFVNYCPLTYIDNCELTPTPSIFGEKVGVSGGACVVGSTESCNYTCQPDLTWSRNSNSCSAPPPPPPGATPQFTSTPTCTIAANAMSCTGLVGVSVPATYIYGADLKLCDGTQLQTIPPGNASVSVTIPYNTACFNLHPWSFIPVPSTDTVNGSSVCTAGTNWDGSTCAPLPSPAIPTNLNATAGALCGSNMITVTWSSVAGATSYDLLRDGVLVNNVSSPYPHTVLSNGAPHIYSVRAVSSVSGSSAWSAQVSANAPLACAVPPTLNFSGSPTAITSGNSSTLTWTVSGIADGCWASGGWTGWKSTTGSNETVSPTANTTYTLECWNGGVSNGPQTVTITVSAVPPPPALPCPPTTISGCVLPATVSGGTNGSCNSATHSGSCNYTCSNGTWGAPSNNSCTLLPPPPVTGFPTLSTPNRTVRAGTLVPISWDTNNGDEGLCTLTGGTLSGYIARNATDPNIEQGSVIQTINGRTTYTLACPSGSSVLTIDIIPAGGET